MNSTDDKSNRSIWRRALLAAATALLFALAPGIAEAGTFHVHFCDASLTGAGSVTGWTPLNNAGAPAGNPNTCPGSLSLWRNGGNGGELSWSSPVVDGTVKYLSAQFNSYSNAAGGAVAIAKFCTTWTQTVCPMASNGTASSFAQLGIGNFQGVTQPGATVTNPGTGTSFRAELSGGNWSGSYVNMWGFDFTLEDTTNPTLEQSGGTLVLDGWNSGGRTIGYHATDTGSGVNDVSLTMDAGGDGPETTVEQNDACARARSDFAWIYPCSPTFDPVHSIDTTDLSDGPHTIGAVGHDASGNSSAGAPASVETSFKVDNTAPALPGNVSIPTENEHGWQSVNGFDIGWTNGDETIETDTASGLAKACYDLEALVDGGLDPDPVCIDGVDPSISGIEVPGDGDWTAALWTVDAAGNASPTAEVHLRLDSTVPGPVEGHANGWIGIDELIGGRSQEWEVPANHQLIVSGLCGYGFTITNAQTDEAPTEITLTGDISSASIPPSTTEGIHFAHIRAISCAGVPATDSSDVPIRVDLTPPQLTLTGVPAGPWTNQSISLGETATDLLSGVLPALPSHDVTEGASIRLAIDGSTVAEIPGGASSQLFDALPEGMHEIKVIAFDVARNHTTQTFNAGIDRTPPTGAFVGSDAADPTTFRANVSDALAGVAGGTIEYAPFDGTSVGAFKPLATTMAGGQLVATFPDTKLPRGTYALRAQIHDAAGNSAVLTKRIDGSEMRLSNPLRQGVSLTVGGEVTITSCKRGKHVAKRCRPCRSKSRRKRLKCKRRTKKLRSIASAGRTVTAFGHATKVTGQLKHADGTPIANRSISIFERHAGKDPNLVGAVQTTSSGRFTYVAPAGASRTITAYFAGSPTEQDTSGRVEIVVPTKVSLKIRPAHVRVGRVVKFSGHVSHGAEVSANGRLVQLQFRNGRKWQSGPALVHADAHGNFVARYRFKRGSRHAVRIRFRAIVPNQAGWPYATGASKQRTAVVSP